MIYKKYEAVWLVIVLLPLSAAVFLPALLRAEKLQWILIACVSAPALLAAYKFLELKSWNSILSLHLYSCDMQAFLAEIQELVNSRYIFKHTKAHAQFLIVDALLDSGKFEQAFTILQAIDINKKPRRFSRPHYDYLFYSVKYHIYMEDKNAAETELILLKMEAEKYKPNILKYRNLMSSYTELQNRLMFLKQEYKGCREYFSEIFEAPLRTPYEKSFSGYYLGVISLARKETERAKDCFTYAAENGNTLFIAERAGEQLEMMNAKAV